MTILEELLENVANGSRFRVDLEKRDLLCDYKYLIKAGAYSGVLGTSEFDFQTLEDLYHTYKYSLPTERSESKRRKYFKAMKETELTDEQMCFGEIRDVAQAHLEAYVLCSIINGSLVWDSTMPKWFWQSTNDKDLVLLKQWIA